MTFEEENGAKGNRKRENGGFESRKMEVRGWRKVGATEQRARGTTRTKREWVSRAKGDARKRERERGREKEREGEGESCIAVPDPG